MRRYLAFVLGLAALGLVLIVVGNRLDTGSGPDHRCNITVYRDGSWRPVDWNPEPWPPPGCNFVVFVDKGLAR